MKSSKWYQKCSMSWLIIIALLLGLTPVSTSSAAKKVSLSSKKLTITVGKSKKLKLKNNKKKVKWKVTSGSKNIKLKSKKKTGVTIVAKKKGSAKVQAKVGKKKYTCKVTVTAKKPSPEAQEEPENPTGGGDSDSGTSPSDDPAEGTSSPSWNDPTNSPSWNNPTQAPSWNTPTQAPWESPTQAPWESSTQAPWESPTQAPWETPTQAPWESPTQAPWDSPTQAPWESPTQAPWDSPTQAPWESPTQAPWESPTQAPWESPTQAPWESPTQTPSWESPTQTPSWESPTQTPSWSNPTQTPSGGNPTATPTKAPTATPTTTAKATATPTATTKPTATPTKAPTQAPTATPTQKPTATPTVAPTATPTPSTGSSGENFDWTNKTAFMIGNQKVALGMTKDQAMNALGSGASTPTSSQGTAIQSPQGYDVIVYNPGGTYDIYAIIYLKADSVISICAVGASGKISYGEDVKTGTPASDLTAAKGWLGVSWYEAKESANASKAGEGAYECKDSGANVIAFVDYYRNNQVYCIQAYDNTVKRTDLTNPANQSMYTTEVFNEMKMETAGLLLAYCRAYKEKKDQYPMNYQEEISALAQKDPTKDISDTLISYPYEPLYAARVEMDGNSDSIGFANSVLEQKDASNSLAYYRTKNTKAYYCTYFGIGATYTGGTTYMTIYFVDQW